MTFTPADWIKVGLLVLGMAAAQGRAEMHAKDQDRRADQQDAAIAELRSDLRVTDRTIQTLAMANQKLADAIDSMQNPHRVGPVRPVR